MTPKGRRVIKGHCDILYDPKVTLTFVVGLALFMTLKGHGVIRGRCDLLYDPKGHGDLCGQFDLVFDPKSQGPLEVAMTYFMTLKFNLNFVVGLT